MAKKFVRTPKTVWDSKDKSTYNDSIVFIEDAEKIYSNGKYYGTHYGVCDTAAATVAKAVTISSVT